jgi:hypothetical protein
MRVYIWKSLPNQPLQIVGETGRECFELGKVYADLLSRNIDVSNGDYEKGVEISISLTPIEKNTKNG